MLLTDIATNLAKYWRQLWDVDDGSGRIDHQHPLFFDISVNQHSKDVTNIESLLSTPKNCYEHKVNNIHLSPTSMNPFENKIHSITFSEFLDKYPGYNLASTYAVNRGASQYCVGDACDKTSGCTFKDSVELENFKNLGKHLTVTITKNFGRRFFTRDLNLEWFDILTISKFWQTRILIFKKSDISGIWHFLNLSFSKSDIIEIRNFQNLTFLKSDIFEIWIFRFRHFWIPTF